MVSVLSIKVQLLTLKEDLKRMQCIGLQLVRQSGKVLEGYYVI